MESTKGYKLGLNFYCSAFIELKIRIMAGIPILVHFHQKMERQKLIGGEGHHSLKDGIGGQIGNKLIFGPGESVPGGFIGLIRGPGESRGANRRDRPNPWEGSPFWAQLKGPIGSVLGNDTEENE